MFGGNVDNDMMLKDRVVQHYIVNDSPRDLRVYIMRGVENGTISLHNFIRQTDVTKKNQWVLNS